MRRTRWTRRCVGLMGSIALGALLVVAPTATGQEPPNPVVGPERPVASPVPGAPAHGGQPEVASGAGINLVVLAGPLVVRVAQDGRVIDPSPLPLADVGGQWPDVAFDGENFLVVWETGGDDTSFSIRARRVSPEGEVLDADDIIVSATASWNPTISFDGTNFLVVWSKADGIHRALVSPDGIVVDPARHLAGSTVAPWSELAFNGVHHLLVWRAESPSPEDQRVLGTLVTPDGIAVTPAGFPISVPSEQQRTQSVGVLGSMFLVAWSDVDRGVGTIHAARVDADGTVLDPSGIRLASTSSEEWMPRVASDGTNFLVLWDGRAVRVAPSGTLLDPDGIALPAPIDWSETALSFDGEVYFAVDGGSGARITPGGVVLDPAGIRLVRGANRQSHVKAAADGTNTFTVWWDERLDGDGFYGGRVGPDGQALDGSGFRISEGISDGSGPVRASASVGFDGTTFLVAWLDLRVDGQTSIRAATVSRAGVVLDRFVVTGPQPLTEVNVPVVGSGDGLHLVVWQSTYDSQATSNELRGARVDSNGTVLDPAGIPVAGNTAGAYYDVALGDTGFLVVWGGPDGYGGIDGTLVARDGTRPDPDGFTVSDTTGWENLPQVAWNGSVHLVVWNTLDVVRGGHDVFAARVDGTGTVLDPQGLSIAGDHADNHFPTVAANGPFLVSWIDRRRVRGHDREGVVATRVDADGTVAHPGGYPLLAGGRFEELFQPELTPAPEEGRFSLAYVRFVAEQPFFNDRAFVRTITPK